VKLIVGGAYNYPAGETAYRNAQDAPLAQVLQHIAQVKPLLHDNEDVMPHRISHGRPNCGRSGPGPCWPSTVDDAATAVPGMGQALVTACSSPIVCPANDVSLTNPIGIAFSDPLDRKAMR
jgi:hypothetical protein